MASFLAASHISKSYPQVSGSSLQALSDFTLQVGEAEVVAVLGPSGCGKTTLLRILAGLIPPSEGEVVIDGKSPAEFRARGSVGFVFQKPVLFPWRTVLRNTILATEVGSRVDQEPTLKTAEELLGLLGLKGFETAYPHELSGGMLQRAAVARALITRPRVLLLDEPFSALDDPTREQLWFDFTRLRRHQQYTVVLVTHSVREAVFFGHRVLVMSSRPGRVRWQKCRLHCPMLETALCWHLRSLMKSASKSVRS